MYTMRGEKVLSVIDGKDTTRLFANDGVMESELKRNPNTRIPREQLFLVLILMALWPCLYQFGIGTG